MTTTDSAALLAAATLAHEGTSFTPEKRGAAEVTALTERLDAIQARAAELTAMPGAVAVPADLVTQLQARHTRATSAKWAAQARCLSPMITGPARFPVDRNRKHMDTADKRAGEVRAHLAAALRRLERVAFPFGMPGEAIRSNDPDALDKLREKLAALETRQAHAKAGNALIRKHGAEARPYMEAAGIPADLIYRGLQLDHSGKPWGLFTTNTAAEIRRLKDRIAGLEKLAARGTVEREAAGGVRLVENVEAARLQLIFPGKPDDSTRATLKAQGFRWAPSEGAWQRHLNNAGRWAAQRVLEALQPAAVA